MALCRTCHTVIPCHCHITPPTQIRPGVYLATTRRHQLRDRGAHPVTREDFEAQESRLVEEIEAARKEFDRARREWDRLCEERLTLRCDWRDQNRRAAQ